MTVDKLSENKVLVVLCTNDMADFSLDYNSLSLNDIHSRKILLRILQVACMKSGIELKNKNVKLEAMTLEKECYILITFERKHRKIYRVKKKSEVVCYYLGESANFLNTIEKLYRQNVYCNKNSAYLYDKGYYLIFDYPAIPHKLKRVLSEYGEKREGHSFCARVKENGKSLCEHNAIFQIGKHLV